jgi:hypothetical protein
LRWFDLEQSKMTLVLGGREGVSYTIYVVIKHALLNYSQYSHLIVSPWTPVESRQQASILHCLISLSIHTTSINYDHLNLSDLACLLN